MFYAICMQKIVSLTQAQELFDNHQIKSVGLWIVYMNMMRKIDLLRAYANSWYVSAIEEVLNQVYQTKDSWLAIVLHKTGLGRIVTSFPSILYFVADMLFKTNGRICFIG